MKSKKIVISLISAALVISLMGAITVAENQFIEVDWWNQPDPHAGMTYWAENEDGSLSCIELMPENFATIAYVPPGYVPHGTDFNMPRNFDLTVDLTVPDDFESWSGFYIRADEPQSGFGGYLFHINTFGLGILEQGVPLVENRIGDDLILADDWNRIRVRLIERDMKVWINGEEVYSYNNAIPGSGYIGLTTNNYKASYRNYILITDQETIFPNFVVDGTEPEVSIDEVTEEDTTVPGETEAAEETAVATPTQAVEDIEEISSSDSDNTVTIIIVIAGLIVVAGVIAGIVIAKKK